MTFEMYEQGARCCLQQDATMALLADTAQQSRGQVRPTRRMPPLKSGQQLKWPLQRTIKERSQVFKKKIEKSPINGCSRKNKMPECAS
jgi:hypothetical protein